MRADGVGTPLTLGTQCCVFDSMSLSARNALTNAMHLEMHRIVSARNALTMQRMTVQCLSQSTQYTRILDSQCARMNCCTADPMHAMLCNGFKDSLCATCIDAQCTHYASIVDSQCTQMDSICSLNALHWIQ